MNTTTQKTIHTRSRDGVPGVITYGWHYLKGNSGAYFSVTAWYKGKNRNGQKEEFGGCCHDEILAKCPDLKPLVDLHLSDAETGEPMHAKDNGWYWMAGALGGAGERYHGGNSECQHWKPDGSFDGYRLSLPDECLKTFAEHCRISMEEAGQIRETLKTILAKRDDGSFGFPAVCKAARRECDAILDAMRPRWKAEADAARAKVEAAA